uniref:Uncharacterized protein n=1 Tax=viral metagenome TaxID=1070528 RepID=A0A6M3KDT7_9ZZZZ
MGDESTPVDVGSAPGEVQAGAGVVAEQLGDVRWVYEHYGDSEEQLGEGDAPSKGAWGLLCACRRDKNAYLKVLERIHPRDGGLAGEESAAALLDLEARVQREWGELAGVLDLACRRPEFVEPLARFAAEWGREHPRKSAAELEAIARNTSNVMEPDEVPL